MHFQPPEPDQSKRCQRCQEVIVEDVEEHEGQALNHLEFEGQQTYEFNYDGSKGLQEDGRRMSR